MANTPAVLIRGLTKHYGKFRALDGLDLTVRTGEVHGFKGRACSKGSRQKVALIAALASDVELLLLDEPTSGLDPLMEAAFREVVGEERARGRTVLLSSHVLSEVEALCDQVTIIREGRMVQTGTLAELRQLTRITISAELERTPDGLAGLAGVHDLIADGPRVRFQADGEHLQAVLAMLTAAGVRTLTCQPATLEELFLRHNQVAA